MPVGEEAFLHSLDVQVLYAAEEVDFLEDFASIGCLEALERDLFHQVDAVIVIAPDLEYHISFIIVLENLHLFILLKKLLLKNVRLLAGLFGGLDAANLHHIFLVFLVDYFEPYICFL